jgi:hypothetical protein
MTASSRSIALLKHKLAQQYHDLVTARMVARALADLCLEDEMRNSLYQRHPWLADVDLTPVYNELQEKESITPDDLKAALRRADPDRARAAPAG